MRRYCSPNHDTWRVFYGLDGVGSSYLASTALLTSCLRDVDCCTVDLSENKTFHQFSVVQCTKALAKAYLLAFIKGVSLDFWRVCKLLAQIHQSNDVLWWFY